VERSAPSWEGQPTTYDTYGPFIRTVISSSPGLVITDGVVCGLQRDPTADSNPQQFKDTLTVSTVPLAETQGRRAKIIGWVHTGTKATFM